MKKKKIIIYSSIIVLIVLTIILFTTYAFITTKVSGNSSGKKYQAISKIIRIEYSDGTETLSSNINDAFTPGSVITKTFTVTNTGDDEIDYTIYLENVTNTFTRYNDITYELYDSSNTKIYEGIFPKTDNVISDTYKLKKNESTTYTLKVIYNNSEENQIVDSGKEIDAKISFVGAILKNAILTNAKNATGERTIYQETPTTSPGNTMSTFKYDTTNGSGIEKNASTMSVSSEYQSYYWIYGTGYTVDESTGKFTLTGVNSLSTSSKTYANMYSDLVGKYLISNSASNNSVADTLTANPITTSNISNVYKVTAATTSQITYKAILPQTIGIEKTMSKSQDDYGDSYYYRGKVIDNYINFAEMCWRIVRIEGDSSVKLILEDQNTTCDSSSYTGNWDSGFSNFGYDSSTYSGKSVINYLNPVSNASSALVNKFKTFQTGTLTIKIKNAYNKELSDYLKAGDWCYDDTAYASNSNTSGTPLTEEEKTNYYNGTKTGQFFYDSNIRLAAQSTKTPTNKCNGTILNKFNDNTDMYVATLTADEIIYAGGKFNTHNYGYYLLNDYQRKNSNYWFALSPFDWYHSYNYTSVFIVSPSGHVGNATVASGISSRLAIQLKSTIEISGGDGTKSNPYIVR